MLKRLLLAMIAAVLVFGASADAKVSFTGTDGSRTCLKPSARALLARIEAQFGRVQIVSTCRRGARIRGTGKRSKHATGEAIDFSVPGRNKAEVVRWLRANHHSGGIMTYRNFSHIHVDVGYRYVRLGARG